MLEYVLFMDLRVERANAGKERRKEMNIHGAYMHFLCWYCVIAFLCLNHIIDNKVKLWEVK